jgi:hypothetical protein
MVLIIAIKIGQPQIQVKRLFPPDILPASRKYWKLGILTGKRVSSMRLDATWIGSIGVSLLLLAFFLNLFRYLRADGYPYLLMNVTGGSLSCLSSCQIHFLPFVILEGTWAAVAAVALAKAVLAKSHPPD